MHRTARPLLFALLLLAGAFPCACGGSSTHGPADPVTDVAPDTPPDLLPNDADDPGAVDRDVPAADPIVDTAAPSPDPAADSDIPDSEDTLELPPAPDSADDVPAPDCPGSKPYDYKCDLQHPDTCPGGICAYALCLGPKLDPDRWATCGDHTCSPCENAFDCPIDCAPAPTLKPPALDDPKTLTVWVHGFGLNAFGSLDKIVYGSERGCSQFLKFLGDYGEARPCADTPEGAASPIQWTAPEYYGGVPAPWLTPADIAELDAFPYDGADALERYSRIVAKFIRWKLASTGATSVNLACHSMGCLITRVVLERDIEGLVSQGRIARWFTFSGALAGARFARLYDNPTVKQYADLVGMSQADYVILNPDFVVDRGAWYDHKPFEGNSPNYHRIFVQHLGGTSPHMSTLGGLSLADVVNPTVAPDDGVLFTQDMYFHSQAPGGSFVVASGAAEPSSMAFTNQQHVDMTYADTTGMLGAAALFHRRKVVVTLSEVSVIHDLEGFPDMAPADVALEAEVRYPYVLATFGKDVMATEMKVAQRSAPEWPQAEGTVQDPGVTIFGGPVFDAMQTIQLDLRLVEVDNYPTAGIVEIPFKGPELMAEFHGEVPLTDHEFAFEGINAKAKVKVRVVTLY